MIESAKITRYLINAVDKKLRAKTVDLSSGVNILRNGFAAEKGTSYADILTESQIASCKHIYSLLNSVNKTTGYRDTTLTAAVQRLCDGYAADEPMYSFGLLSDLHIQYNTGLDDFQRALTYLKYRVPFTCVCGDLVSFASAENMAQYKKYVDDYAGNMLMYEVPGNHETFPELGVSDVLDEELWKETTGKEPYYSFEYGGDVFIFLGINRHANSSDLFKNGALEWLEATLKANKDKRCFVFQHIPESIDACADPSHSYDTTLMGVHGQKFVTLMKKYKNTIWFHGHTHVTLGVEQYPVSNILGYQSAHIPSLVSPRFYDVNTGTLQDYYYDENNNKIWGSLLAEGYICDVYKNRIVLRGINFASGTNRSEVMPFINEVYVLETIAAA